MAFVMCSCAPRCVCFQIHKVMKHIFMHEQVLSETLIWSFMTAWRVQNVTFRAPKLTSKSHTASRTHLTNFYI